MAFQTSFWFLLLVYVTTSGHIYDNSTAWIEGFVFNFFVECLCVCVSGSPNKKTQKTKTHLTKDSNTTWMMSDDVLKILDTEDSKIETIGSSNGKSIFFATNIGLCLPVFAFSKQQKKISKKTTKRPLRTLLKKTKNH